MLKLFTNINFLTETHRKKVFPVLFDLHFSKNVELSNYYELVDDVGKCDIVVFPIDYSQFIKFKTALNNLQQLAKRHDKPIWIYTGGDFGFTNCILNSYTFRLGGFHSKLSDSTFIMPSFVNNPYLSFLHQGFSAIEKKNTPSIGFVGHAKSGLLKYVKEILNHFKYKLKKMLGIILADDQSFYPSSIKRSRYLHKLKVSKALECNFILRNNYGAGMQTEPEKQKSTQEFYNNIFNNAYTFCSRGVGNFSVRFYETLAVGRIPILLNTDCRLPLGDSIDWTKHIIILEAKEKVSFERQILAFHKSYNNEAFKELQKNNRKLWETHLMRTTYFIKIHDVFLNKMS